jgi:hypothetical protein
LTEPGRSKSAIDADDEDLYLKAMGFLIQQLFAEEDDDGLNPIERIFRAW